MLVFSSNKENSAPFIRDATHNFFGVMSEQNVYSLQPVLSNYQSLHWMFPNVIHDDISMTYREEKTPYIIDHITTRIPEILTSVNANSIPLYTDYVLDRPLMGGSTGTIYLISDDQYILEFEGLDTIDQLGVIMLFMPKIEIPRNKYVISVNSENSDAISILSDYLVMAGSALIYTDKTVGTIEIEYDSVLGYYMVLNITTDIPKDLIYVALPQVTIEEKT